MPRRNYLTLLLVAVSAFLIISFILTFGHEDQRSEDIAYTQSYIPEADSILHGEAIAQKLENATLKAELGNAAWKLLHTTMAKFPDKPTKDDSESLKAYIYLFARLYPCGECARHFQKILTKYPPQVSSRQSAAGWACFVHNQVNSSLKKELFDCSKIGEFYDCGCGEDDKTKGRTVGTKEEHFTPLELEKEGYTRGG